MKYPTALAATALLTLACSAFAADETKAPPKGLYEIKYDSATAQICLPTKAQQCNMAPWHGVQFASDKQKPLPGWGGYYGFVYDNNCSAGHDPSPTKQSGGVKFYGMVSFPEAKPGESQWESELIEVAPDKASGWIGRWTRWNNLNLSNVVPYIKEIKMTRVSDCQ